MPGSDTIPESVTVKPGQESVATWPGFQMLPGGGSRVFVQTTVPVKPELKRDGKGWLVLLPDVKLAAGNVRRPLDTHYFATPVRQVRARQMGSRGVAVLIAMSEDATPTVRTEKAKNGYFFVYIEFGVDSSSAAEPEPATTKPRGLQLELPD